MEHQNIRSLLDSLIERGDGDLIFSHILNRLSPSYIISSSPVSNAFAFLLSRASNDELLKLLPNNVAHSESSPIIPTSKPPVISQSLFRIASDLRVGQNDPLSEDEDLKLYTEKYWKIHEGAASLNRTEHDPAQRFTYLSKEESRIPRSIGDLHCRDRLVKVLKENERHIASKRIRAELTSVKTTDIEVQSRTNQWLANQLNLDVQQAKRWSNMWRKYVDCIVEFGPGILRILGGSTSE